MTKLEINLQKLINSKGFDEAKSLLGLSSMELIQKSDCKIDFTIANDITRELFDLGSIPFLYKNCQLSYNDFSGVVDWICDWDGEEEQTVSMATQFWEGNDGIPVDTDSYRVVDSDGAENLLGLNDLDSGECYTYIEWTEEFNNLASYDMWIRRFYLPKVHSAIQKHLDNYRNYQN